MIYTDVEIEKELDELDIKNEIFFVSLLPSFIWDRKSGTVVEYASSPSSKLELKVIDTDLIKLEKSLKEYIKHQELSDKDVLVFCVNPQYFPKDIKDKWVRVKIMKVR